MTGHMIVMADSSVARKMVKRDPMAAEPPPVISAVGVAAEKRLYYILFEQSTVKLKEHYSRNYPTVASSPAFPGSMGEENEGEILSFFSPKYTSGGRREPGNEVKLALLFIAHYVYVAFRHTHTHTHTHTHRHTHIRVVVPGCSTAVGMTVGEMLEVTKEKERLQLPYKYCESNGDDFNTAKATHHHINKYNHLKGMYNQVI